MLASDLSDVIDFPDVQTEVTSAHPWSVEIASRFQIQKLRHWHSAFANVRKDYRYYELVEDTIHQEFEYTYFVIKDEEGMVRAIQPCFINDQDMTAAASPRIRALVNFIRRAWPRFLRMRTLMIGSPAGEGHLDAIDGAARIRLAESLALAADRCGKDLRTKLIVFKEFPKADRPALACLTHRGFTRIPSMPMTRLRLNFESFEDYLQNVLSRNMRSQLRRKYKASSQRANLEMRVVADATPYVNELYPLYLAVYERSDLKFEKLSPEYFSEIGKRIPDKTLFFFWLNGGKIVAFNLCLVNGDAICSEYLGFDYSIAFDLHLYYITGRDVQSWAIANNYEWYRSTALNYEPKYRLRHELEPLDLYVKHRTPFLNFVLKRVMPFLEPTRYDKILKCFSNYEELHK